jgi:phage portal protein BeeE
MWPLKRKQPEPEQETVSSGAGMFLPLGSGNFMALTSQQYAKEGYAENVITHACIHKIASAASSVGLQLQKGEQGDLADVHPVLDLLRRPNPMNSGSDFIYSLIAWRLIGGEAFIVRQPWGTGKPATGKPTQLWLLEPHKVTIKHGLFGMPTSYEYVTGGDGDKLVFPVG